MAGGSAARPTNVHLHVEATNRQQIQSLRELWGWRDVFAILALRDYKVRYRQALIGAAWSLLQPVAFLIVLFPVLQAVSPPDDPSKSSAWLRLYAGLILWQFFSGTVNSASQALSNNYQLISKVFFPRIFLPMANGFVHLVDLGINLCVLGLALVFTHHLRWQAMLAPLFILWTLLFAWALGVGLSALNAMYRDVSSLLPFLLQLAFFASGIFYDVNSLSEKWQVILGFNPMLTAVEGFRWSLLGGEPPAGFALLASIVVTMLTCFAGVAYFARTERRLADYL